MLSDELSKILIKLDNGLIEASPSVEDVVDYYIEDEPDGEFYQEDEDLDDLDGDITLDPDSLKVEAHGLSAIDLKRLKDHASQVEDPDLKRILNFLCQSNVLVNITQDVTKMKKESVEDEINEGASHKAMLRRYNQYFAQYRRSSDVSSKIRKDADYDIGALVKRRTKKIPDDVPFGMSDIFSGKEIDAIMKHPNYNSLDRNLRDAFMSALEEEASRISDDIDDVIVNAFLSETKELVKGLASEAAYRAGMATHIDGVFRLSELGLKHGQELLHVRMRG